MATERTFAVCHKATLGGTLTKVTMVNASSRYQAAVLYATAKGLTIREQWGHGVWWARAKSGGRFDPNIYIHVDTPAKG